MKYRINVFFLIIFILFPILYCNESDKPIIAFGYLTNKSDKKKYNYLETVFPNSFASSIKTIFKVQTKTPDQIDNLLRNQNQSLKKKYDHLELSYLVKMIGADIFVSGSFEPLTKKLIKITLAVYIDGSNEIFEFTNIEKMETQIASLIDRVTLNVINYMSENNLYMRNRISPGARLAILTNLDGEEQNRLLSTFMKKGYTISSLQNNYLINPFNNDNFEFFRFIRTKINSYDIITDWKRSKFYHSTWTGSRYIDSVKVIKNLYQKYDINYIEHKDRALEKLYRSLGENYNLLLIVGFSENRKKSWVRAIDMKEKDLILVQSNIKSDLLSSDPIVDISEKIIYFMKNEQKISFIKKSVEIK